ncbi:hypothetical protein FEA48_30555 [Pseudomonas nitroreducens]|uniref:RiboL-PSP-HEPN domain-containing protein n=1 Tax=Pseudomonas nitroreducens TaxID=46680 RepID=A0A5R8ZSU5_PSENT|nr:hypothetical protein [Pseudomonas nitroreducens]TLP68200.1 hypothetical protein FEA48_30555 [Pseudomonas nitroreducens]
MLVEVCYVCDCGEENMATVMCAEPEYSAEHYSDSEVASTDDVECAECGEVLVVTIINGIGGARAYIEDGGRVTATGYPYHPEDYAADYEELTWVVNAEQGTPFGIFKNQVSSVERLLQIDLDDATRFSHVVMLYGHIVAAVEGYLSSTFIGAVSGSFDLTRRLVETDSTFADQKFSMAEIFKKAESIKVVVASYLAELIFHRLDKVKPMYKSVLGIDFGDISWLFKAVSIRHDCVHRAGFDKSGERVAIDSDAVFELVKKSCELVESVEFQIVALAKKDGGRH